MLGYSDNLFIIVNEMNLTYLCVKMYSIPLID